MHAAPVIGLIDTVESGVDNYWETSIAIEEPDNFLGLSSSVDMQARYPSLFYRLNSPFYDFRIDSIPRREAVVRRSVRCFDDKNIAVFGLRCLRCEGIDTVDVASVQYRRVWCVYEKLSGAEHVSRVERANTDVAN